MKRGMTGKIVIYVLLIVGSVVFVSPLVWMVSTSLKPADQAMSITPRLIAHRSYLSEKKPWIEVQEIQRLTKPSLLVRRNDSGVLDVMSVASYEMLNKNRRGRKVEPTVEVIERVDASEAEPWVFVKSVDGEDAQVVKVSEITQVPAPRWGNYGEAIKAMTHFWLYLGNTVLLCVLTVGGTVLSCSLVAYGFSRVEWAGRDKVFIFVMMTMMIPFPVVMVPLYSVFRELGWIGSLKPLWVPSFFAAAFNVFLLRQFFMGIPKELSDAARVDGCSEFRIYWQIILPLAKPALMVVALFTFMGTWNDFLGPLIYLTDQKDFTLALGLQFFQSQSGGTEWHYLMAASTLVVLPIIVLFFFTQKTFIEGISLSGVKG